MTASYVSGSEDPNLDISWYNNKGLIKDFSDPGWTFVLKIFRLGIEPVLVKNSGFIGSDTDPNLQVVWSTGELEIPGGNYNLEIKATKAGRDQYLRSYIEIITKAQALIP